MRIIKKLVRLITRDEFMKLNDIDSKYFNRIAKYETPEWKKNIIQNGGIYRSDWIKVMQNQLKQIDKEIEKRGIVDKNQNSEL